MYIGVKKSKMDINSNTYFNVQVSKNKKVLMSDIFRRKYGIPKKNE